MRRADQIIERCRRIALCTEEPGHITRTFLSEPMREVHALVRGWMEEAGLRVSIDGAGNIRGLLGSGEARLYIGSHLDTVPHAGAFDGILGVMIAIALARPRRFAMEVIGFSEEEGVRFGLPFIGSRALAGDLSDEVLRRKDRAGVSIREAITQFGLDPGAIPGARTGEGALGFVEFHIEQGPALEHSGKPLAVVDSIAGQSRLTVTFHGSANHAGTTPMHLRRDALAGAAEWIGEVERAGRAIPGMVTTVGMVDVRPGAGNVIPGEAVVSLDARHASDSIRCSAVEALLGSANEIAVKRNLTVSIARRLEQASTEMDLGLSSFFPADLPRMTSGAGHDAMIMARSMPAAMLFLRSAGGISHHPDESVLEEDVEAALEAGEQFLEALEASRG